MKKYIFILIVLFPVLLSAQSSKYFYYYKGEKQYLELNTDYLYISVNEESLPQKQLLTFANKLSFNKERLFEVQKSKDKNIGAYWSEIELDTKLSRSDYLNLIDILNREENIQTVSPYFKTKDEDKIGLSNFFYVKLKQLSDSTILNQQANRHSCVVIKQDRYMPHWYILSVTKESKYNALELSNMFYESGLFECAEPDLMVSDLVNCANDTYFNNQWGFKNTGQYGGTLGVDINVCDAWSISKGTNVIVAVIDHGIELTHPDLQANIHPLSYDTESGSSPSIVRGPHGTACAGIIGAVDNSIGVSGVAPDCKLMSISNTLMSNTTNIKSKLANGINWAWRNDAQIISNSWGHNALKSSYIDNAIDNALTIGRNGLGCVVVFASGNDYSSVNYPANSNQNILSVGAISRNGNRASFSNYGSQLDIVAPGVNIYTTDRQGDLGYNHSESGLPDISNRDYTANFGGTSAAAPHVAGVVALILSIRPDLTGKEVRDVIEQTAQKVGGYSYTTHSDRPNGIWNNEMGYGLVDAHAAVVRAIFGNPTLSVPPSSAPKRPTILKTSPQEQGWSGVLNMVKCS